MVYKFFIVAIMVFIKAIFSASDTAFTYLNKYKIAKQSNKDKRSKKILYFIEDKTKFYGIIEVVITMIELLSSAYASEAFVNTLAINFETLGLSVGASITIAIIIVTIVLSYVLLVFGGIFPKQIARNYPEKTAYALINFLWIISKLNYPFELLVRKSTKLFHKIFKINDNPKDELTEKEIKMMIYEGQKQGVIDSIEKSIALKALNFDNILVKHIMIKKDNVDFINIDSSTKEILDNIKNYSFTRIPIYKDNINNVIGVFNIKDLIIYYAKNNKFDIDLNKHIREIIFVDKNEKISKLFKLMQSKRLSLAVVLDENKNTVGIITLEDILEKLMGKIYDEYDKI